MLLCLRITDVDCGVKKILFVHGARSLFFLTSPKAQKAGKPSFSYTLTFA